MSPSSVSSSLSEASWEKDLERHFTPEEWETMNTLLLKGSRNVQIQETNDKLRSRWYRTPALLHRFQPAIPNTCWRSAVGTLLHIWWQCPSIASFRTDVRSLIATITGVRLDLSPATFLLYHFGPNLKISKSSLILHSINAAKTRIPRKWKSTMAPTLREWLHRVDSVADMEAAIHYADIPKDLD